MHANDWVALWIAAAILALLFIGVMDIPHKRRMRELARSRPADTYADFETHFAGKDFAPEMVRAVYAFVQHELASVRDFPVRPLDDLRAVYAADDETIELVLEDLLDEFRRVPPWHGKVWSLDDLRTVEDIVLFLASAPNLD